MMIPTLLAACKITRGADIYYGLPLHPSVAQAALRQKKAYENELDRIAGTRMTLETQVNAIESANMNLETMTAMRKGADALRNIHGSL
jgi:flagellar hook-basal body complex protein FliE